MDGITANRELMARRVRSSAGLATALNPYIGYENATLIAREAVATGRAVADLVLERELLTKEELDQILQPEVLTRPYRVSGIERVRKVPPIRENPSEP